MLNRLTRRKMKSASVALPPEPRQVADITKDYQQVSAAAISSQYQIYVHERALKEYNERMYELNQEAAARQKLDDAAKAKTEEKSDVQS